jgi:hypothetical protein
MLEQQCSMFSASLWWVIAFQSPLFVVIRTSKGQWYLHVLPDVILRELCGLLTEGI